MRYFQKLSRRKSYSQFALVLTPLFFVFSYSPQEGIGQSRASVESIVVNMVPSSKAVDMLRAINVPFDPEALFQPDWRAKLATPLSSIPEMAMLRNYTGPLKVL
jgi:hypothetical protein